MLEIKKTINWVVMMCMAFRLRKKKQDNVSRVLISTLT